MMILKLSEGLVSMCGTEKVKIKMMTQGLNVIILMRVLPVPVYKLWLGSQLVQGEVVGVLHCLLKGCL